MSEVRFIANQLNKLMTDNSVTDQQVADAIGVSRTTVYYWRRGRDGEPVAAPFDKLAKIAEYFKVPAQYFLDDPTDSSLIQKKMSAIVADIADVADSLPPSKQREFREIGKALAAAEKNKDINDIYNELMSLITRLVELDGGGKALNSLIQEIETLAARPSPPSVEGRPRQTHRARADRESSSKPTKSQK